MNKKMFLHSTVILSTATRRWQCLAAVGIKVLTALCCFHILKCCTLNYIFCILAEVSELNKTRIMSTNLTVTCLKLN